MKLELQEQCLIDGICGAPLSEQNPSFTWKCIKAAETVGSQDCHYGQVYNDQQGL